MPTPPTAPARTGLIEYDHPSSPQIGRWIRKIVVPATTDQSLGRCTKLEVVHFSVNNKPQGAVGQVAIPRTFEVDGVDTLVREIVEMAQEDANNLHQGIQRYAVFARFEKDANYNPRCYFRIAGKEEYDPDTGGADPSEPADAKGLVAQLMRHNEAIMRSMVVNSSYMMDTLRQENASQRILLDKQAEQAVEVGALIQEMLDNSTGRRLQEKESENKQAMLGATFEHLKLLFPVLLNKLAGQKVAPETDASFTTLAALFESMTQEQQQAFVTTFLQPSQVPLFGEFLASYEKRKQTLTKTSPSSPAPSLNLPKLFDPIKEQSQSDTSSDPKLGALETRAKTFKALFSMPKLEGPVRPAKD